MKKHNLAMILALAAIFYSSESFASDTYVAVDFDPLIFLPFEAGTEVYCVQGNHGSYSHQGTQEYAFDINMGGNLNSPANPIFGEPLYSPFHGFVREIRQGVPDFSNNSEANSANHYGWGNTIVIQAVNSPYYLRLAHLQHNSIPDDLEVGDFVWQGDLIGAVGQTGYSTSPHLHMQMQESVRGESIPVDLVEGRLLEDHWVTAELEPEKYVIDEDQRTNLGAPFEEIGNRYSGDFSRYTTRTNRGETGDSYRASYEDGARFYWAFNTRTSGEFEVYATCRSLSNRDRNTQYRIMQPGPDVYTYIDQRELYGEYAYIGGTSLREGYRYQIRARRSSNRMCADAIILQRVD